MKKIDYSGLNKEQLEAVNTIDGPVLLIASAGTGKTYAATYRMAHLIEIGVPSKNILMLTFTNKAANEMLKRAQKLCGSDISDLTACTYHSFCAHLLRQFGEHVNIKPRFSILSSSNCVMVMTQLKETSGYKKEKGFPTAGKLTEVISFAINKKLSLDDAIDLRASNFIMYREQIHELAEKYIEYKQEQNLLDYDDLLIKTIELLKNNNDICKHLSDRFKYIMVDEYQDSNLVQMDLLSLLRQYDNKNLCVIGDEGQSIYNFRGANFKNIMNFPKMFDNCKIIVLNQNYRSNQEILNLANDVINQAPVRFEKNMTGQWSKNSKPEMVFTKTTEEESQFILNKILNYYNNGISLKKIAVLIRNSYESNYLETLISKLPVSQRFLYKKFGGIRFLEKEVCQDIIAYLNMINESEVLIYWVRFLSLYDGIGAKTAENIAKDILNYNIEALMDDKYLTKKYAPAIKDIYSNYKTIKALPNIQKQVEYLINTYYFNLKKNIINTHSKDLSKDMEKLNDDIDQLKLFIDLSYDYSNLDSFLDALVLDSTTEKKDDDYLTISTIHSAKGLEWDIVFIMNVIDEDYPGERALKAFSQIAKEEHNNEVEEGRRLLYVALTRARNDLYIMTPLAIKNYSGISLTNSSRFMDNVYKKDCNINIENVKMYVDENGKLIDAYDFQMDLEMAAQRKKFYY